LGERSEAQVCIVDDGTRVMNEPAEDCDLIEVRVFVVNDGKVDVLDADLVTELYDCKGVWITQATKHFGSLPSGAKIAADFVFKAKPSCECRLPLLTLPLKVPYGLKVWIHTFKNPGLKAEWRTTLAS